MCSLFFFVNMCLLFYDKKCDTEFYVLNINLIIKWISFFILMIYAYLHIKTTLKYIYWLFYDILQRGCFSDLFGCMIEFLSQQSSCFSILLYELCLEHAHQQTGGLYSQKKTLHYYIFSFDSLKKKLIKESIADHHVLWDPRNSSDPVLTSDLMRYRFTEIILLYYYILGNV